MAFLQTCTESMGGKVFVLEFEAWDGVWQVSFCIGRQDESGDGSAVIAKYGVEYRDGNGTDSKAYISQGGLEYVAPAGCTSSFSDQVNIEKMFSSLEKTFNKIDYDCTRDSFMELE